MAPSRPCACGWRGRSAGVPVICLGNLTVGGAGKTPAALAVGHLLHAAHERPFFLTRGYGGRLPGPLRVNPEVHHAADVGDEPLLLGAAGADHRRTRPSSPARNSRSLPARASSSWTTDCKIPALTKNLAIVVVDGRRGVGNGRVIPAGPLRAPLGTQLDRAQALVVVGPAEGAAGYRQTRRKRAA